MTLRRQISFIALTTVAMTCTAREGRAQEQSHDCGQQYRIKFLDDLIYKLRPPFERDPYEERIETERHDFTQSTTTVGRGIVQFEGGYAFFYNDDLDGIESSHTGPEAFLRFGLSDDIEFRLRWNYAWKFRKDESDLGSAEDLRWSFKLGVTDEECWIPESALEIRSTAPTGGDSWSTNRVEYGIDYIYGWTLREGVKLYGSTGFGSDGLGDFGLVTTDAGDRFQFFTQSIALGLEVTEDSTAYFEFFGIYTRGRSDELTLTFFNIGVDYYLSHNWVFDVRVGVGLSRDADDFFSGIGGGYRF